MQNLLFLLSFVSGTSAIALTACQQIAGAISGGVYYSTSLSTNYATDIEHYMISSTQEPTCVVEVANVDDISAAMQIIGSTKTEFSVICGGHASNPGFSSTTGIFLSLTRMKDVTVSADKSSVTVQLGNIWSNVYSALAETGLNVVGGRVTGPGVGGFSLGGGYSWLTDQYGLTSDTISSYQLVLPNGTITTVNETTPDLFFALKGGLNKFGIVSELTLNAFSQGTVYGGIAEYAATAIPALINATNTFQATNTDPKAQVILTLNGGSTGASAILLSFYDGPSRPEAFAPYDDIVPLFSTVSTQSFYSFSQDAPSDIQEGNRGAFHTMMTTTLTTAFMEAVYNETLYYSTLALEHGAILLSYDLEPFTDYGQYDVGGAFPHSNSPKPLNLYFSWSSLESSQDDFWRTAMQTSIDTLTEVAKSEGIYSDEMYAYPNYALDTYAGAQLYGPTNAARLQAIKEAVDPDGVMDLTGGFSFT